MTEGLKKVTPPPPPPTPPQVDPSRFVDCFIAEQNLVGVALGMAYERKVPLAATFACFFSRAYDFIRMAGYSKPPSAAHPPPSRPP
jgi:transketolase